MQNYNLHNWELSLLWIHILESPRMFEEQNKKNAWNVHILWYSFYLSLSSQDVVYAIGK